MTTCLVTGGAGFIGSWLCKDLVSKGYDVVCLDNLITGKKENISTLLENDKFTFIKRDVSSTAEEKTDYIFHLASPASPVHYQMHPVETMLANSSGTLNMLRLALSNNAKFLYTSSSEVYGDPLEHPQRETYWGNVNPNGPRSCYDESKRFAEALITSFGGVDYRIIRIFNTYGPYMNSKDGRAVPNFITQALDGRPITIYGDGRQTRSFCYVTDMINALELAMFSKNAFKQVMNIGNPHEVTVMDIAKLVLKLTGSKSK